MIGLNHSVPDESGLYLLAFRLSLVTIFYNIAEGIVSMYLGYSDDTLALFGFGADSFIEVLSGTGIAVMILRMRKNTSPEMSGYERAALRTTGISFYLLSAGLLAGIIINLVTHRKPETTFWGIVISLISIVAMFWLMSTKRKTGRRLQSEPIIADANCTMICIYMSVVLLLSSIIYELTGFQYADVIGAAGLIYFSVSEGREAFEKTTR